MDHFKEMAKNLNEQERLYWAAMLGYYMVGRSTSPEHGRRMVVRALRTYSLPQPQYASMGGK